MPPVGRGKKKKEFAYSKAGKKAAAAYRKRLEKKKR